jgi:hypothetical protein
MRHRSLVSVAHESNRHAPETASAFFFFAAARCVGQTLWYHTERSLTWFPFRRMRCLHFGHVPNGVSLARMRDRVL